MTANEVASPIDPALRRFLENSGLVAEFAVAQLTPLTGGVSSDIFRVTAAGRTFVIKRALARLRVAQEWNAPVSRNAGEVGWMRAAAAVVPHAVPQILAADAALGVFAMEYLDPVRHPVWKQELRDGRADAAFAADVGRTLALIHAATAFSADAARRFETDDVFHAIRLEPYLEATARAHADLADTLMRLSAETLAAKRALVHGDVSPKNILVGPHGPVFLDAECAWFGEPAFDLAFCLNHLLLKCLWTPAAGTAFLHCFDTMANAYLAGVTWEPRQDLEARAARLLPALFLARIDGKSPVEYIESERGKAMVRLVARQFIETPPARLADLRARWAEVIAA